jgi:hypothetical protein
MHPYLNRLKSGFRVKGGCIKSQDLSVSESFLQKIDQTFLRIFKTQMKSVMQLGSYRLTGKENINTKKKKESTP